MFASAVTLAISPKYEDRRKALIPATCVVISSVRSVRLELTCECRTWLIAEAVTDVSIALALLLELRKVKSSFKETRR